MALLLQHLCSSLPAGASVFGLLFFLQLDLSKVILYYYLNVYARSASFYVKFGCKRITGGIFRNNVEKRRDLRVREEDIVRAARLMLPVVNLVISKTRELFSGEPPMTLKVVQRK